MLGPDKTPALCLIDLCLRGYESCSMKLTVDRAEAWTHMIFTQFLGLQTISRLRERLIETAACSQGTRFG